MPHKTTAADIMTTRLITLSASDNISHAIGLLVKHRISGAPVVDMGGRLVGMLSEKDCMRVLVHEYYETSGPAVDKTVADLMTTDVFTIAPDMLVPRIAEVFLARPFRRVPVVADGKVVGQISRRDVLVAIHELTAGTDKRHVAEPDRTALGDLVTPGDRAGDGVVGPALNRKFGEKVGP